MIPQFLLHRELMNTADVSASQLQDVEPISKTYILLQLLFDFSWIIMQCCKAFKVMMDPMDPFVVLFAWLHKNCFIDFQETWMEDESLP